jgi:hypothetical protein
MQIFGTVVDGKSVNIVRIIGRNLARLGFMYSKNINLGVIAMTFLLGVALIGMRGETVVQITLLITLSASLVDFFIGSLLPITAYKRRHGFQGYSCIS